MTLVVGLPLQRRTLTVLAGVHNSCLVKTITSASVTACTVNSVSCLSRALKKLSCSGGVHRRLVLGLGATFWAQYMAGAVGGKSFVASAKRSSSIEQVLKNAEWPEQFPFKEEDFQRFDESSDSLFYESPRFVTHIDDPAIAALTKYYSQVFPPSSTPGVSMLDMCSSWVSHYPKGYKQERIVGMGMNEEELKRNPVRLSSAYYHAPFAFKADFSICSFLIYLLLLSLKV
ncbi:hypothetical protein SLEP1_g24961 [Rubroshorea leprosula]|uniref:Uncharacterized protein n=1 Tax=Rubroshorea leprosula TaxID=152421 RepID=A0AAV5JRT4_9ROSI|nr:hypothetical protein SLEP1_g24961 [Rubroshorea leprosula]